MDGHQSFLPRSLINKRNTLSSSAEKGKSMKAEIKDLIKESIKINLNEKRLKIEPDSIEELILVGVQYADPQRIDGVLFYDTTLRSLVKFVKDRKRGSNDIEIGKAIDTLVSSGHIKEVQHPYGMDVFLLSKKGMARMKKSELFKKEYK